MFADLLLNRPITLPAGEARKVTYWDKTPDYRNNPYAIIAANNTERVYAAIVEGCEAISRIADRTLLSRGTVYRAVRELLQQERIHFVRVLKEHFYAPIGKQPRLQQSRLIDSKQQRLQERRQRVLDAIRQLGGRATTNQISVALGISKQAARDWINEAADEGFLIPADTHKRHMSWQEFTGKQATHAETGKPFAEVKNGNEETQG